MAPNGSLVLTARELWESQDKTQWLNFLCGYPSCVRALAESKKKGPGTLIEDDDWIRTQAPKLLSSKKFDAGCMSQVVRWKLSKGVFRPKLQQMADSLDDEEVKDAIKSAMKHLPNNVLLALKSLTVLKGIGPATASAVLAASDGSVPFFSDEAYRAATNTSTIKYTEKSYVEFCELLQDKATSLNKQKPKRSDSEKVTNKKFTPDEVQQALWSCHYCHKNKVELVLPSSEPSEEIASDDENDTKRPKMQPSG
eukprot:TRINITY_DN6338_c0_g1_i1.p1 TRINITY_DN6338_c0_g1~~TRINITY_DN6338_c0_g1_i1.p1  ORF type:complete len:253 (+),score=37.74 TRINITY_DN6338_c0_g1_i1:28-786(+)